MPLRLDPLEQRLDGSRDAGVDPRREVPHGNPQRPGSEHERREDTQRPRGSGLVRGRDHDVVITGHESVPPGAVEMMIAVDVDLFRHTTVHDSEWCHQRGIRANEAPAEAGARRTSPVAMVSGALSHVADPEGLRRTHSRLRVPLRRSTYEPPDVIETTKQ